MKILKILYITEKYKYIYNDIVYRYYPVTDYNDSTKLITHHFTDFGYCRYAISSKSNHLISGFFLKSLDLY